MSKIVKRVAALVVMLGVVLGFTVWRTASTTITYQQPQSDAPVVLTVNGDEVRADEYATYMIYNMKYYENMYAQYGVMGMWEDEEAAAMMGAQMPGAAREQAVYSRVVLQKMKEAGLKLSYKQEKELSKLRKDTIDQAQSYDNYLQKIAQFGFTDESYTNFMYISQCYSALNEYYFGENGVNKASEEELMQYFRDNYMSAKHILIMTTDPATGEQKRTDEEAKALAQSILDRINNGEDFDKLMQEYSEDSGLEGNPDGYIFTEGEMVAPFYDGAKALDDGKVSGLVKSDFGYHIIKREPLDYEGQFTNYQADLANKMGKTMDNLLTEWITNADVQTTDVFDEITYKNVYDYASVPNPNSDAADGQGDAADGNADAAD
ncbi:MAG: peptidylprolyl isomerase [Eubacteriales bacterium]|nr:peptidylprolyl isomerase [Eubacteriales bacterium]